MKTQLVLYLCMGSACHQLGGFRLVPQIEGFIRRHGLEGRLELKGAFCLEKCEQGRSLKFCGRVLTGLTEDNLEERLLREVAPHLERLD
jgi:NADH:ubiquinone oxidoreductase subunit E